MIQTRKKDRFEHYRLFLMCYEATCLMHVCEEITSPLPKLIPTLISQTLLGMCAPEQLFDVWGR